MATLWRRATLVLPVMALLMILAMGLALTPGSGGPPQVDAATTLDLSMVRPGDILLGRAPTAAWARHWPTYYTHAALVLDKYNTLEIRGPGQRVEVYPITDWVNDFGGYYERVAVLRVKTNDFARQAAVNKAKEQHGKRFVDPANPLDWYWATLAKFPNPQRLYCSALIFHGYKWGVAIDLDAGGGAMVWPDDIAVDNDVQYISVQSR